MENLFEMANVSKKDTGLQYDLWLDSAGKDRNNKHSYPRIKVKVNNQYIPILIDKINPTIPDNIKIKDFKGYNEIKQYIKQYYSVLMDHFNGNLTDKEALILLGKYDFTLSDAFDRMTNLKDGE